MFDPPGSGGIFLFKDPNFLILAERAITSLIGAKITIERAINGFERAIMALDRAIIAAK